MTVGTRSPPITAPTVTLPSYTVGYDDSAGPSSSRDVDATCLIRIQFRFPLQKLLCSLPSRQSSSGPETVELEVACRVCNGPLVAREGQFVLKYFLLREASRLDARRPRQGSVRAKPTARPKNASVSSIK